MKIIGKPVEKLDAKALLMGKPVYTDDFAPADCLTVKLLHSPYPFAKIISIDTSAAEKIEGIVCILTYKDVPHNRFTIAGQTYPEPSPYDRLILDKYVRYVGDTVAIVAAEDEKAAVKALDKIKVEYEVLDPVLDFEKAMESETVIHPEKDFHFNFDIGGDKEKNLCSSGSASFGDADDIFPQCDCIIERKYHTTPQAQAMMETFRAFSYLDHNDRLTVVTSTQIPFHVRRILSRALSIPKTKIRVIKPRIGGGFGAKQTAVCEMFCSVVTLKTGRPAKIVYDRKETFSATNSRHEMRVTVKLGAMKDGTIRAIKVSTLSNTGAYGEHGPTTVGLSGTKTLGLYNKIEAGLFSYDVVYTNKMPGGALRGYGATQGFFAVESAINELASILDISPIDIRLKNIVSVGEIMKGYSDLGERLQSSGLVDCIKKGKNMIDWDNKKKRPKIADGKARGIGMAICLQGSGIAGIDTAAAQIRLNDDGFYTLQIGATDMGTGCDTILCQMAAEVLDCPMDKIIVSGVDTDYSPFDTGSYASSTTYVTGNAVVKAAMELRNKIISYGAKFIDIDKDEAEFDGLKVYSVENGKSISLDEIAQKLVVGSGDVLSGGNTFGSPVSPPPFMAGFADVEVDLETGQVKPKKMVGIVDCGTVINENLARLQAEGGLAQGIGFALYEDVKYSKSGRMLTDSFMNYKIPTRLDVGVIDVDFAPSYEPTGPFGAKSIGEVVINTPAPAIAAAVYDAVGVNIRSLPISSEKVFLAMEKNRGTENEK